ncbi:MAG: phage terminase small subunit P27 family [Clostridia bacterium]|nr:phage terminase small subunit P27 family [Clostridia bacterium]
MKPFDCATAKIGEEEKRRRKEMETEMKGNSISQEIPDSLSPRGKEIYRRLLRTIPDSLLTENDEDALRELAFTIDNLITCEENVAENGILIDGKENPALRVYRQIFPTFDKLTSKFGMSPRDRAGIVIAKMKQEEDKEKEEESDMVLKLLKMNRGN